MITISEYKFKQLIVSEKIEKGKWEVWFDAKPAGYVVKDGKQYNALNYFKKIITQTEKLADAKQFVAMNRAESMGIEVNWN